MLVLISSFALPGTMLSIVVSKDRPLASHLNAEHPIVVASKQPISITTATIKDVARDVKRRCRDNLLVVVLVDDIRMM